MRISRFNPESFNLSYFVATFDFCTPDERRTVFDSCLQAWKWAMKLDLEEFKRTHPEVVKAARESLEKKKNATNGV